MSTASDGQRHSRSAAHPPQWIAEAMGAPIERGWAMDEHGYAAPLEHELESRFAISNGVLGVRASIEIPTMASHPRTFVAGLFGASPRHHGLPALISMPDWLRIRVRVGDDDLLIGEGETLAHSRALDLRHGLLRSDWTQRTPAGHEVRLQTLRLVSLDTRSLGLQIVRVEAARPVLIELEAWLEPVAEDLLPLQADAGRSLWRTAAGEQFLAIAESAAVWLGGGQLPELGAADGRHRWRWAAAPGRPADLVRTIRVSRAGADSQTERTAEEVSRARRAGGPRLLAAHQRAWTERWDAAEVALEGDEPAQQALRFSAYHLIGAANPESSRTSVGARALTGDGYLGHVFWDTEIFLLPFYTLTWPEAARAMLLYRHRTLPAARAKAAALGYRGALYAWESAATGEEATPPFALGPDGQVIPIRSGVQEHHISADVAYAVWQYWHVTHDHAFLREAGAEIVIETARFWASRARREADGFYHIRGVIGPDEYHETVDDNAYTNRMARWNLECGLAFARLISGRWPGRWDALRAALHLSPDELEQWEEVASRLVSQFDEQSGLYEQFEGFFGLEAVDLAQYAGQMAPMDVVLGPERTRRSQVIKQADVLMLLALLGAEHTREVWERNFDYYEPRCGHGSSLSPPVHGLIAARLGRMELARRYFEQTAAVDLDDTMGNSAAGVHIAALGGLWQLAVFGFGGLEIGGEQLRIDPHLPDHWRTLAFPVRWRGRRLRIEARGPDAGQTVAVTLLRGRPLRISIGDAEYRLRPGEVVVAPLSPKTPAGGSDEL